jgi:GMP synthase-like glutamine amidotransferase
VRIHWIQHVAFEDLGTIQSWAESRSHALTSTLALTEDFPSPAEVDWLIVMGGPMSANDELRNPWLIAEKRFIGQVIDSGARVLGICLGAQLVADVLGGAVRPNSEPEIGWFPVRLTHQGRSSSVFGVMPETFVAGHWHGDTFELPPAVVHTASSETCPNQAFEYEGRVWGLQCHLEWDRAALERLVSECGSDLVAGRYIQSAEQLLGQPERFDELRELMHGVLDAMEGTNRTR